jgi:hypothetical protein
MRARRLGKDETARLLAQRGGREMCAVPLQLAQDVNFAIGPAEGAGDDDPREELVPAGTQVIALSAERGVFSAFAYACSGSTCKRLLAELS